MSVAVGFLFSVSSSSFFFVGLVDITVTTSVLFEDLLKVLQQKTHEYSLRHSQTKETEKKSLQGKTFLLSSQLLQNVVAYCLADMLKIRQVRIKHWSNIRGCPLLSNYKNFEAFDAIGVDV
jgi:hypothetical protein